MITRNGIVLVLLLVNETEGDTRHAIASGLIHDINNGPYRLKASAGVGRVCHSSSDYARSYREAVEALSVLQRLRRDGSVLCFERLGVLRLLFRIQHKDELAEFVDQTVGALRRYDESHGGSLMQTVHAYLDCNGNLVATARALNIHVNSLLYRLQRIRDIAKVDLDDAEARLDLHVALKVLETIDGAD